MIGMYCTWIVVIAIQFFWWGCVVGIAESGEKERRIAVLWVSLILFFGNGVFAHFALKHLGF